MLFQACLALRLTGKIKENTLLPDVAVLDPQSRIDIDDGLKSAFIRADGTFSLDLEPGSYKLDVLTGTHYFIPIRIDVQQETYQVFKLNQNNNWREHGPQLSVFEIEPVQVIDYFMPRQQFSVMSLLSNPMILMSVVTFGLFFLLPKLKDQIDPEALKEYQESKPTPQELPDISQGLANWFLPQEQEKKVEPPVQEPTKKKKKK